MAKLTKEEFVASLKEMTILEIKELVDGLKEEFGIDPTAVAAAPAAGAGGGDAAPSEVSVVITSGGASKIAVIKEVRTITGLGLKEAKELVDGAPKMVKEGISKDDAEKLKEKFAEVGATVTLK